MSLSLSVQISIKRKKLAKVATQYGLHHPATVRVSQELDKLVLEAQRGLVR